MNDNKPSGTRELIAEAEAMRAEKKARVPKTRQLVREAESLIGREGDGRGRSKAWMFFVGLALAGGGAVVYFLMSR